MRIVVTGAAGFIGGHVCAALGRRGVEVVGVDNFDPFYDRGVKERTVRDLARLRGFRFVEADIRDAEVMEDALAGTEAVVHLAARAGVRASVEDPGLYAGVNVAGTAVLLEAARGLGIRRFVFGSSSAVYGNDTAVPFREDARADRPISPYAATKRAGELLCQVYAQIHGMRIASLRFFTVYGPRQRPDLAIHTFTRLLSQGRPIVQYGDGSAERDHTHVEDIVGGVLGALAWTAGEDAACEHFNLGDARPIRLDRLIALIAQALRVKPEIKIEPPQDGDVMRTCADITKARTCFGYEPQISIEDGIAQFVRWYEGDHGR